MDIDGYLAEVRDLWKSGQATEHSYRPALQALFTAIDLALEQVGERTGRPVPARRHRGRLGGSIASGH